MQLFSVEKSLPSSAAWGQSLISFISSSRFFPISSLRHQEILTSYYFLLKMSFKVFSGRWKCQASEIHSSSKLVHIRSRFVSEEQKQQELQNHHFHICQFDRNIYGRNQTLSDVTRIGGSWTNVALGWAEQPFTVIQYFLLKISVWGSHFFY